MGPVVPVSGSRKARFRWTGPGPAAPWSASAHARAASGRQLAAWASSGTPGADAQRTTDAKSPDCSIVCGAPVSCSSGGRSAVHTSSGTPAWCASTTEGSNSATAVPLVTQTTTGRPLARAIPRAKKPALRSSSRTWVAQAVGHRHRQGRRARPGAHHGVGDPARRPTRRPGWRRRWPVRSPTVALHVEVRGSGPPLVLLHGFTQTGRLWGPFGERLGADAHRAGRGPARPRRLRRRCAPTCRRRRAWWPSPRVTAWARTTGTATSWATRSAPVPRCTWPSAPTCAAAPGARRRHGGHRGRRPRAPSAGRRTRRAPTALEASGDVAGFVARWLRGPMFARLSAAGAAEWAERLRNSAAGLARACGCAGPAPRSPSGTGCRAGCPVAGPGRVGRHGFGAHALRLARGVAPTAWPPSCPAAAMPPTWHSPSPWRAWWRTGWGTGGRDAVRGGRPAGADLTAAARSSSSTPAAS